MIPFEQISLNEPRDTPSYALALMIAQFPGSWLPYGAGQVIRNAQPYFKLISKSSGRLAYSQTIGEWPSRVCFQQETMEHYRIVFEKV